ncbi:MAG: tetratricopeptide repeat protein [Candidatus Adiutrix sp.]|jgi:type IV pilus biogenesis/stability protein PilW|nr:tetratricopeptide repeat protein [Candidatus Adiutrix sp.]
MTALRLQTSVFILALALAAGCISGSRSSTKPASSPNGPAGEEARAQINLGAALLMQGEYGKALPELLRARELAPRNADVENYLGLAYYYGEKEYDLAVESFQKALQINPDRTDVHNHLGLVHLARKEYEPALAEFNYCLKDLVYQKKQLPLVNIGLTYMEMGDYDQALTALTRAVEVAPEYAKSYQLIGRIHMRRNNLETALDYLGNAARLDSNDPDAFMDLGELFTQLGKPEEAAQAYSRVSTLVPNTPLALEAQRRGRKVMGF